MEESQVSVYKERPFNSLSHIKRPTVQNSEINTKVFNTVSIEPYPVADPIYFHGKHVTYRGVLCSTVEKIGNEYGAQGATVQHYCSEYRAVQYYSTL